MIHQRQLAEIRKVLKLPGLNPVFSKLLTEYDAKVKELTKLHAQNVRLKSALQEAADMFESAYGWFFASHRQTAADRCRIAGSRARAAIKDSTK